MKSLLEKLDNNLTQHLRMIFDVIKGIPVIKPEALTIPELREIWMKDESIDKSLATKKITYLYHLLDPRSDYSRVGSDLREPLVNKDHLVGFTLDDNMLQTIDKIKTLRRSVPERLLDGVEAQLISMGKFLETSEINEKNIAKIALVMSKCAELVSTHQQLVEKVAQSIQMGNRIKRDVKPNMFDDDNN